VTRVFVDTSGLLALLVPSDECHARATKAFERLREQEAGLLTSSYVLLETYSLLGRRFGPDAVQRFRDGFAPLLKVVWVDSGLHEAGLDLLLASRRRVLSLTDAVSIALIGREGCEEVFASDPHLKVEGARLLI
jgi:predicted nucleic acid-binding protein